jgi:hypothetical protein
MWQDGSPAFQVCDEAGKASLGVVEVYHVKEFVHGHSRATTVS